LAILFKPRGLGPWVFALRADLRADSFHTSCKHCEGRLGSRCINS
jgi:hypothetical protein